MKIILPVIVVFLLTFQPGSCQPISQYSGNPHYFYYKEKPMVLVTSGEHYGANNIKK